MSAEFVSLLPNGVAACIRPTGGPHEVADAAHSRPLPRIATSATASTFRCRDAASAKIYLYFEITHDSVLLVKTGRALKGLNASKSAPTAGHRVSREETMKYAVRLAIAATLLISTAAFAQNNDGTIKKDQLPIS